MNSDQIVEFLSDYGVVSIFQSDRSGGWHATINLFMKGVDAKVCSGFGHSSMLDSLEELQARAREFVSQPPMAFPRLKGSSA